MTQLSQLAAVIAILGTAVVYGTDVFCAMVLRPALARVDDRALGTITGFVHAYGDKTRRSCTPMTQLSQLAAVIAILGTAVVYGTDLFCAMVLRPALARVDDRALGTVTGFVHAYGDKRMPVPGAVGVIAAASSCALAVLAGRWAQAIPAGIAFVSLVVWLLLYLRVSAPINRQLTAAANSGDTLPNVRALQASWDRIIDARAALQGLALGALCITLIA